MCMLYFNLHVVKYMLYFNLMNSCVAFIVFLADVIHVIGELLV